MGERCVRRAGHTDLGADHGRAQVERVATLGRDPLALDADKLFDALEQLLLIERLFKEERHQGKRVGRKGKRGGRKGRMRVGVGAGPATSLTLPILAMAYRQGEARGRVVHAVHVEHGPEEPQLALLVLVRLHALKQLRQGPVEGAVEGAMEGPLEGSAEGRGAQRLSSEPWPCPCSSRPSPLFCLVPRRRSGRRTPTARARSCGTAR